MIEAGNLSALINLHFRDLIENYKTEFRGQLVPALDSSLISTSPDNALVQTGPYRSLWIRIYNEISQFDLLKQLVEIVEDLVDTHAGLYFAVKEDVIDPQIVKFLRGNDFKFYHFHEETSEFIYYKWISVDLVEDAVPTYATSIEGGMAICLSPDETQVLLVKEYGGWKGPGGAINEQELALEGVIREVKEETNLTIDTSFEEKLVVVWNYCKARDGNKNDNFYVYVLKVENKHELDLDYNEIDDFKWVDIQQLVPIFDQIDHSQFRVKYNGELYNVAFIQGLKNYMDNKYFSPHPLKISTMVGTLVNYY